jgi:hypothetical protein
MLEDGLKHARSPCLPADPAGMGTPVLALNAPSCSRPSIPELLALQLSIFRTPDILAVPP